MKVVAKYQYGKAMGFQISQNSGSLIHSVLHATKRPFVEHGYHPSICSKELAISSMHSKLTKPNFGSNKRISLFVPVIIFGHYLL